MTIRSSFPTLQVRTCEPLVSGREIILMPLCLVHFVQFLKKHRNLVVNFHGYSWTLKTGFPWLVSASKIGHSYWAADVSKRNPNQPGRLNKQKQMTKHGDPVTCNFTKTPSPTPKKKKHIFQPFCFRHYVSFIRSEMPPFFVSFSLNHSTFLAWFCQKSPKNQDVLPSKPADPWCSGKWPFSLESWMWKNGDSNQKWLPFQWIMVQWKMAVPTLESLSPWKLTYPPKVDGWKMKCPFKRPPFRGHVNFGQGTCQKRTFSTSMIVGNFPTLEPLKYFIQPNWYFEGFLVEGMGCSWDFFRTAKKTSFYLG